MAKKTQKAKAKTETKTDAKVKLVKPRNGVQYSQSEFYQCVQQMCGLDSKRVAKDVYTGFAMMVQAALKKGYRVPLPGLGKILVRQSKARMGRNPATGEIIHISARKRVRMTPSKALKEAVLR